MEKEFFFLNLISGKKQGFHWGVLRGFLRFLSGIYWIIVQARVGLYQAGFLKTYSLLRPVISIGNITTGGTGKTPAVIMLARQFHSQGKRVVVLSRGYKSKSEGREQRAEGREQRAEGREQRAESREQGAEGRRQKAGGRRQGDNPQFAIHNQQWKVVSDGKEILLSPQEAGDEPYLMAKELPATPVIVGKDRVKSGSYALGNFAPDLILLDDGFQYLRLGRDLNIVLVDTTLPWGYNWLLPAGLLREPKKNLQRADIFLLTKVDETTDDGLEIISNELKRINPRAKIVRSTHKAKYLREFPAGEQRGLSWLNQREIIAISSIARPESFEKTLKNLGAKIVKDYRFPDHYNYSGGDLKEIFSSNYPVVTTSKDAVRLPQCWPGRLKFWILQIELELSAGEDLWQEELTRVIG